MKFLAIVFLMGSLLFSFLAVNNFWDTKTFLSKATKGKGKVIDFAIEESYDSEEEEYYNSYYPIVEFEMKNNDRSFQFQSSSGSGRVPAYSIGQEINIYYLKIGNTFHAEIDSFFNLWGFTIFLAIFGIVPGFFSLLFFKAAKHKPNNSSRRLPNRL